MSTGELPPTGRGERCPRCQGVAEMRKTAAELRASGGCNAIEQAIMWERKADEAERPVVQVREALEHAEKFLANFTSDRPGVHIDPRSILAKVRAALALTPVVAREPVAWPPREPTEEMLVAAREWSRGKYGKPIGNDAAKGCWQTMLDASPPPAGAYAREPAGCVVAHCGRRGGNCQCTSVQECCACG